MKVQKSPGAEIMRGLIYIKHHCELGSGAKSSSEFIIKETKKKKTVLKDKLAELHWTVLF